ncbi:MAG: amidase, partial [candidate division NC10 bacterium]|nr:amidase [candidate division NC10 bacterium]
MGPRLYKATKAATSPPTVIIGKTNMDEFALGGTTINPHYGSTRNPW